MIPIESRRPEPPTARPPVDHTPIRAADQMVVAPSQPAAGVVVVQVEGELDGCTTPRVHRVLSSAIVAAAAEAARPGGGGRGRVVCDLDGLDFLAVSALGVLVELSRSAAAAGVEFVVVASGRPVRRVLELTGLDEHLATVPAVEGPVPARRAS